MDKNQFEIVVKIDSYSLADDFFPKETIDLLLKNGFSIKKHDVYQTTEGQWHDVLILKKSGKVEG